MKRRPRLDANVATRPPTGESRASRPLIPSLWIPRLAVPDEDGATRVVLEHRVVLEPPQELHQQERVPLHPFRPLQEVIVWLGAQDIGRDQRHGLALERPKADMRCAAVDQIRLRLLHRRETLVRTKGQDPCHGKRGKSWPELPYRYRASWLLPSADHRGRS